MAPETICWAHVPLFSSLQNVAPTVVLQSPILRFRVGHSALNSRSRISGFYYGVEPVDCYSLTYEPRIRKFNEKVQNVKILKNAYARYF